MAAVVNATKPKSGHELRSFLGLVNYYGRFIRHLASVSQLPLNKLLCKNTQWKWTCAQDNAFRQLKQELTSAEVLVHYDVTVPLKLACDASAYSIGADISHTMPEGSERPKALPRDHCRRLNRTTHRSRRRR